MRVLDGAPRSQIDPATLVTMMMNEKPPKCVGKFQMAGKVFRWGVVESLGGEEAVMVDRVIFVEDAGSHDQNEQAAHAAASLWLHSEQRAGRR